MNFKNEDTFFVEKKILQITDKVRIQTEKDIPFSGFRKNFLNHE